MKTAVDLCTGSFVFQIASLKCGHFFGLNCIDKWLKTGHDCPNCNDKATKKDIR
jgi:E3 ubiquitin-protein ligase RFWD3